MEQLEPGLPKARPTLTACLNGPQDLRRCVLDESVVKSPLGPMAFPGGETFLDSERCLALSRWSLKVAMVFEFTGDKRYFTDDERREFKEFFAMPENLWIWAGRYDGPKPVHGVERRAWAEGEPGRGVRVLSDRYGRFRGAAGARASQVGAAVFSVCGFDAGQHSSAYLSAAERTARLASTRHD
jgi:hypothetical protein